MDQYAVLSIGHLNPSLVSSKINSRKSETEKAEASNSGCHLVT